MDGAHCPSLRVSVSGQEEQPPTRPTRLPPTFANIIHIEDRGSFLTQELISERETGAGSTSGVRGHASHDPGSAKSAASHLPAYPAARGADAPPLSAQKCLAAAARDYLHVTETQDRGIHSRSLQTSSLFNLRGSAGHHTGCGEACGTGASGADGAGCCSTGCSGASSVRGCSSRAGESERR